MPRSIPPTSLPALFLTLLLNATTAHGQTATQDPGTGWPSYLGGPGSSQYSSLGQINKQNVAQLQIAWEYRTGDARRGGGSQIQCNPIVIDGVLYATSPALKVFALDAATGEERWSFDPYADGGRVGASVNRGVAYWSDGPEERILSTAGLFLYALDAKTGSPSRGFGQDGRVDLRNGLGRDASRLSVSANTPGIVYEDLLILGARVSEGLPAAPGHIRAYDVRTGSIEWIFHTIPQPGELGYDTWPEDAYTRTGGVNAWAGMSIDRERGIVYAPTGSAAYDFYGGDRAGANLFANSLLALDAKTGKRIWHFQAVHHDIWDRDLPAPPNLVKLKKAGREIDAVAQITKSGHVFIFDRATGEPFFPIDEKPYPPSEIPGEETWPTQPLPAKPPAFARQRLTEDGVTNISEESRAFALERLRRSKSDGQFIPPSREGTIIFPSYDGGGEWGGAAVDPRTGIMYVNSSEMAWILTIEESTSRRATLPYRGTGYIRFLDPRRLPRRQTALGNAQRHRPQQRRNPLESAPRRIPRTHRPRNPNHRNRTIRRTRRYRLRPNLHSRLQRRTLPSLRHRQRKNPLGNSTPRRRLRHPERLRGQRQAIHSHCGRRRKNGNEIRRRLYSLRVAGVDRSGTR